jgi:hypothetical protein
MDISLERIVEDFAWGMKAADSKRPQAINNRSGEPFSPGIGPHTEARTIELVRDELVGMSSSPYAGLIGLQVPYPSSPRAKCDLCIGEDSNPLWAIEVKMLRLIGDNGKVNDNILMHILSPYPAHRSAVTDCEKLVNSRLGIRQAILIFGYDHAEWTMLPAIEAFELLARDRAVLSERVNAAVLGLEHPFHQQGQVFGWEIHPKGATELGD